MRIGIDCRSLNGAKTGIGYYTYHLIEALSGVGQDSEFYLYSSCSFSLPKRGEYVRKNSIRGLPGNLWLQTVLPFLLHKDKITIFHAPLYIVPFACTIPKVVTVHDLTFYIYPELACRQNRAILQWLLPASIKAADAVIADSKNTKQDIINYLGTRPEKIKVIPLAASEIFQKIHNREELDRVKLKYSLPEEYMLFVGTIEPRKNLERLLKAYKQVIDRRTDLPHQLVMVGRLGWLYKDILRIYHDLGMGNRVKLLGYVDEEDMSAIYNGAALFVYPSLYEGFGLPVLEAMACGIPVITSNISSLPEVAGNCCHLVNPLDVEELAYAIERILESPTLQGQMAKAGLARSREFSWRRTAEETFKLYSQVQMRCR